MFMWLSGIQVVSEGNLPHYGGMFLILSYEITKNTCVWSWIDTEIMMREVLRMRAAKHWLIAKYILKLGETYSSCNVNAHSYHTLKDIK
jgi:hypothetical protein